MEGTILVKDCWGHHRLIDLAKVASVSLDQSRLIDGVNYPQVSIEMPAVEGSEELSSSAQTISVTGQQAIALRDFFENQATHSFLEHDTAEDAAKETEEVEPEVSSGDDFNEGSITYSFLEHDTAEDAAKQRS
jgi:hypothetical protein